MGQRGPDQLPAEEGRFVYPKGIKDGLEATKVAYRPTLREHFPDTWIFSAASQGTGLFCSPWLILLRRVVDYSCCGFFHLFELITNRFPIK